MAAPWACWPMEEQAASSGLWVPQSMPSRGPGDDREMSSLARPQLVQGQALGALVSGCPWNASLLLDSFQFLKKTRLVDF